MCHAAGGKESGIGVMNKKEFAYPISVSFWIWLELTVVRLCLGLVFTNASWAAEGQTQLLFCLQGLSFFRETLQWMSFKPFSFQLRQQIPFLEGFSGGGGTVIGRLIDLSIALKNKPACLRKLEV